MCAALRSRPKASRRHPSCCDPLVCHSDPEAKDPQRSIRRRGYFIPMEASSSAAGGRIRVGCSGWVYNHWKKVFYPKEVPQKGWFEFYAQHFDTVEINNTFYRLPKPETFAAWRQRSPE